jgi:uncharacterized membrane protein
VALLFVSVLFELGAALTKRASLVSAARWVLIVGVLAGWPAALAGHEAAHAIPDQQALGALLALHARVAFLTLAVFTFVLVYRWARGARMSRAERRWLWALSTLGFVGIIWTGALGGTLVFRRAAGVATPTLQRALLECLSWPH